MTIYTGYVYLWYDTRAKFFYLGGHKGKVEDSYICSNKMMLRAYKKRPETFKFRVLEYVYGDNKALREAEQRWLNMIKDEELYWTPNIYNKTVRYYNQKKHSAGGNGTANKGKSRPSWSKGYTKDEINLRRDGLLSFFPLDIPKKLPKRRQLDKSKTKIKEAKPKFCKVYSHICEKCAKNFYHKKDDIRFCSLSCRASNAASLVKVNGMKKEQTRKSFSNLTTGRKMSTREDGTRYWTYPDNEGVYFTEYPHKLRTT